MSSVTSSTDWKRSAVALPRIALVGAGTMGSFHARVIAESDFGELAAVIDPYEPFGSEVAERYGAEWRPAADEWSEFDGVVIAAATEAHLSLAMPVIESGVPVLVEKPISDSLEGTRAILARSAELGVPLMCGLLERYNPAMLTAQAMVHAPVHVTASRHSPYAPRIKTGVAWDLLIHDVDMAVRTLGQPISVRGSTGEYNPASLPGAEDVAEVVVGFADGGLASISASRIGQRKVRTVVVHEVDKLIEVDLLRRDVTVYRNVSAQGADDDGRGYRQQTAIEIPELVTNQEPLAAQFERFTSLIDGRIDADEERASYLPAHEVVAEALASRSGPRH